MVKENNNSNEESKMMTSTERKENRNSKLRTTLNQWLRIEKKELSISGDLRNMHDLNQAQGMIIKINGMMA